MPACRIFSTVTYYKRFKQLLDDHTKAVFIANQYSPECLALATAAHQAGKKVLFTNHASAAGDTGYVPPIYADLAALTSQAMADLYRLHTPTPLDVVPFTLSEPQVPMRAVSRNDHHLSIGIYLTALTNVTRLQEIISHWSSLANIGLVFVRLHPAEVVKADLSKVFAYQIPVEISTCQLGTDIDRTDIAVCGNSTVAIEILRGGRPVIYDHQLDQLAFDYCGYAKQQLVLPYPETLDDSIFELLQEHYFNGRWKHAMRYFDFSYQQSEGSIVDAFAQEVTRLLHKS